MHMCKGGSLNSLEAQVDPSGDMEAETGKKISRVDFDHEHVLNKDNVVLHSMKA